MARIDHNGDLVNHGGFIPREPLRTMRKEDLSACPHCEELEAKYNTLKAERVTLIPKRNLRSSWTDDGIYKSWVADIETLHAAGVLDCNKPQTDYKDCDGGAE